VGPRIRAVSFAPACRGGASHYGTVHRPTSWPALVVLYFRRRPVRLGSTTTFYSSDFYARHAAAVFPGAFRRPGRPGSAVLRVPCPSRAPATGPPGRRPEQNHCEISRPATTAGPDAFCARARLGPRLQNGSGLCPSDVTGAPGRSRWGKPGSWSRHERRREQALSARSMEVYARDGGTGWIRTHRPSDRLPHRKPVSSTNTVVIFMSDKRRGGGRSSRRCRSPRWPDRRRDRNGIGDNSLDNLGAPQLVHLVRPRAWGAGRDGAITRPAQGFSPTEGGHPGGRVRHLAGLLSTRQHQIGTTAFTHRDGPSLRPVLELAGVTQPPAPNYRGRDVAPMRGGSLVAISVRRAAEGGTRRRHRHRVGGCFGPFGPSAGATGRRSTCPQPYGPGAWQLYDLSADPG